MCERDSTDYKLLSTGGIVELCSNASSCFTQVAVQHKKAQLQKSAVSFLMQKLARTLLRFAECLAKLILNYDEISKYYIKCIFFIKTNIVNMRVDVIICFCLKRYGQFKSF